MGEPGDGRAEKGGQNFVCRYVSTVGNTKNITKAEAKSLQKAGIDIVIVFETTAKRALSGYAAGQYDAATAQAQAMAAGGPKNGVVYFGVDFDATPLERVVVRRYLDGAAHVLGKNRVGVYGSYYVVKDALDHGTCKYAWQTYAWSGGQRDPRAHLYQYHNGAVINGVSCDLDRAYKPDFGQWWYVPPAPVPGPQDEDPYWVWLRWQLGEGEFENHGSDPAWRPLSLPKRVPRLWWAKKWLFLARRKKAGK